MTVALVCSAAITALAAIAVQVRGAAVDEDHGPVRRPAAVGGLLRRGGTASSPSRHWA